MAAIEVIREGKPTLMEVGAFLRMIADNCEKSGENDIRTVIVVTMTEEGEVTDPACIGFCPSKEHAIGVLHRAIGTLTAR